MKIKNIIWDLSEVLISGVQDIKYEIANIVREDPEIVDQYLLEEFTLLMCGKITEEKYLEHILEKTEWEINIEKCKQIIRKQLKKEIKGTKDIMTELFPFYHMVILSDNAREWVSLILEFHPFLNKIKRQYYSYELRGIKKEKEIFIKVLEKEKIKSEETIFIDDSKYNVKNAEAIGIKGVLFEDAEKLKIKLKELLKE